MKCLCEGEGRGKWTCDPMPYCKVVQQGKREYKPVGASWITESGGGSKKCTCVGKNNIKCIPTEDVLPLTVTVNSITSAESGSTVQLSCVFDGSLDANEVVVTWFKRGPLKLVRLFEFDGPLNTLTISDSKFATRSKWNKDQHILEIRNISLDDSAEYECHVDSFESSGIGIGELDIRDTPVTFTSKAHATFGQSYTVTWKPKVRVSNRAISWQLRIRKSGDPWGSVITRGADQMFYQIKSGQLEGNTLYEVWVASVRTGKNNRKIVGKKSEFAFFVGRNNNIFTPSPMTTAASMTTTAVLIVNPPESVQIKAYARVAELTWQSVPNANYYTIEVLNRGVVKTYENAQKPNIKLTDLSPSNEYIVRIATAIGDTESDVIEKVFNTRPNPPRDVVFAITNNEVDNLVDVNLSWKGNARNFRITDGNTEPVTTSETNHLFRAVRPGGIYQFNVVAIDRYNTVSNPQTRNQLDLTNAVIMQNNLQKSMSVDRTDTTAILTWAPIDMQNDHIKEWSIEWNKQVDKIPNGRQQFKLTNLKPFESYDIRLTGTLENGQLFAHVFIKALKLRVNNLRLAFKTARAVGIEWDPPSDTSNLKEYEITAQTESGGKEILYSSTDSFSFDGLEPNTEYTFSVVSIAKSNDRGDPINLIIKTPPLPPPISPPSNLHQIDDSKNSITVGWIPAAVFPVHVIILVGNQRREPNQQSDNHATFNGLESGHKYKVIATSMDDSRRSVPISVFGYTNPSPPSGLSTAALSVHSIKLSWRNGPFAVDSTIIRLYWSKMVVEEKQRNVNTPNEQDQIIFKNLKPNTQYRITMHTVKDGKMSTIVQKVISTKEVQSLPKPPVELDFTDISATAMTIRWKNNPNSGRRPFPEKWQISYQADSDTSTVNEISGDLTSFQLRGLHPFTVYTVSIRAIDNQLHSDPLTKNVLTTGVAPAHLAVTAIDATTIEFTWEITDPQSRAIENFDIIILQKNQPLPKFNKKINIHNGVEKTKDGFYKYRLSGLTPRLKYTARMSSYNPSTQFNNNNVAETEFQMLPEPVENIEPLDIGSDYMNLAWKRARSTDEYELVYKRIDEQNPREERRTTKAGVNHIVIYNLVAGMEYEINIRRRQNNLLSPDAKVILETILPPPSKVTFTGETSTSISVSWQPSAVWVSEYKIEFEDPSNRIQNKTVPNSVSTVTFRNLEEATLYIIRVSAKRAGKYSKAAVGQHLTSIPKPTQLNITRISTTEFRINWKAPEARLSIPIAKYKISITSVQNQISSINYVSAAQRYYKARGLVPGTTYRVEVSAVIRIQLTGFQESSSAEVTGSTNLDPPRNIIFSSNADGALEFKWSPPEAPFTHYIIQTLRTGEKIKEDRQKREDVEMANNYLHPVYKYKVIDLQEGTEYQIRIAAANYNRTQTAARVSQFLSANATVQSTMPSGLIITEHQTQMTSVLVGWNPPSVPVLYYIIKRIDETDYRLRAEQQREYNVPGSSKDITIPFILPGRRYTISLQAIYRKYDDADSRRYSDVLNGTFITKPDKPMELEVTVRDRMAMIRWKNPDAPVQDYTIELNSIPPNPSKRKRIPDIMAAFDEVNEYGLAKDKTHNEYNLENLEPGQHYMVEIVGIIRNPHTIDEDIETPPSVAEFYTKLDPIENFTATKITTNSISLSWTRPVATITHYDLSVRDLKDKTPQLLKEIKRDETEYTLNNLQPGRRYTMTLKPYQGTRTSENCFAEETAMTMIPPTENVKFEVFTPNYVAITWDSVASATYYTVSIP